jgi:hypothetical protein
MVGQRQHACCTGPCREGEEPQPMMYDREKSDPAIVATKPTNKAGQPSAELVEPRAGAKGNVHQQSTGRALYRETVSQAPTRMRHVARILRGAVTHPRWEPYARIGLVRIYAGCALKAHVT